MDAKEIVNKMYENDSFSKWLGLEIFDIREGYCKVRTTIREEMCNGFNISHGGITYSIADSALAFASNSSGKKALSIETSISHIKATTVGEVITATAVQVSIAKHVAVYQVEVRNKKEELVAIFKGTVYRKETEWL